MRSASAIPPISSSFRRTPDRCRADRPALQRAPRAAGRPRRRHRLHRRRRADARRRRAVDGAAQPHRRDRRGQPARRRRAERHHRPICSAPSSSVGLFYPPDPASLESSSIGGNVAECAGGPRAFKYGTTKRYVLALEAVLPTGEIVRTGSKAVKNVVGYDLTQLLVGSEGTLAIVTRITLRLIPKPPARATLLAAFARIDDAVAAVTALIERRVVPAAIELIDDDSLRAAGRYSGSTVAPAGSRRPAHRRVRRHRRRPSTRRSAGRRRVCSRGGDRRSPAADEAERDQLWGVRRARRRWRCGRPGCSRSTTTSWCRAAACRSCSTWSPGSSPTSACAIASFGHAGDGNIHVNLMVDAATTPAGGAARSRPSASCSSGWWHSRARSAASTASASPSAVPRARAGADEIALMQRVKSAFDPNGILNPGKIFP